MDYERVCRVVKEMLDDNEELAAAYVIDYALLNPDKPFDEVFHMQNYKGDFVKRMGIKK